MGILDRPTLPDWLQRFHAIGELAEEGARLHAAARNVAQSQSGTFEPQLVEAWYEKVRALQLPDDASKKFESEVASLDAYAAKHMTPPTVTTQAMWGFANGFERVVEAVMHGGGTYVRSLGEDAVTMAIVSHLYRYDSVQHDTTIDLRDGSQFGIDDNQLARLVALLVRNDIFDTDRAPYYVRLTEHGREWFEANLRPRAPAAPAQEEEQADASQPPNSGGEINVDEITSYLSFMNNDELRGFVLDDLREINLAFAAGANLSTMILCGSAVEGMVLDIAEQVSPAKLTFASKPNWADSISLPKIVAEFASLGLLTESAKTIALGIGDHRDLVHPNRRRKAQTKIRINATAARAMMSLLQVVAHDLHEAKQNGDVDKLN